MARLFDRIPGDLFSPLARKYKAIYAFALVCLYHCIKLYKTDIKRSDFASLLRSQGEELMALFNIDTDKLDDKDESEEVTGSFKISGFDSSYAHKGKIRLESTDGFVAYFNYEVNNSGDKMSIYPYISCDLNATTLDENYFVIVSPDGTKSYEKLDSFTHSPLDTSTAGEKIGYIKYKNDFYFFKYTVR